MEEKGSGGRREGDVRAHKHGQAGKGEKRMKGARKGRDREKKGGLNGATRLHGACSCKSAIYSPSSRGRCDGIRRV
jgi:hypothetical protein